MARPTKEGLDYFPLDVDAADDPVIKKAIKIFGTDAWAIFTETLSYIYDKKGYYAIYDDLFLFRINDRFGISEQKIADVILYLEQRNVFHIFRLGDDSTVITSEGVQRRYLTVRKKLNRKSSFRINPDIWLLDEIPPEGFLSYGDFSESSEETPENEGFSGEESAQKKRKRKEEKKIGEKENPCPICGGSTWVFETGQGFMRTVPCVCRTRTIQRRMELIKNRGRP